MGENPGAMTLGRLFSLRRVRLGAFSGAGVLALSAALVFANLIGRRVFVRADCTADGRYSLSAASKSLVRSLPDPVLFRAYISPALPQPQASTAQYLEDLLGEYRAAGRGRVTVEIVNPDSSEAAKTEAAKVGAAPVRFTEMASDRFQVREGFLGLAVFYQDKQEVIPFVKDAGNLEYDLTSRLRKMSRHDKKVLGWVTGHGETEAHVLRQGAGERVFDAFDVRPFPLDGTAAFRPDVLVVSNPSRPFSGADLDGFDALVSSGVPAVMCLSRTAIQMGNFGLYPRETGLEAWLEHYGARLEEGVVLDPQCQQVSLQSRQGGFTVSNIINYPAFVLSRPEAHPSAQSVGALMFPFSGPLSASGNGTFTPLARSSRHSWAPAGLRTLDPFSLRPPLPDDPRGPFTLAALVESSTVSFRDPARPAHVRVAVLGSGVFVGPETPIPADNLDFLSHLAEWLAEGDGYLVIPTHGDPFRPLRPLPAAARGLVKLLGYFFLPSSVTLMGFLLWRRRRARRPSVQREWEEAARA